MVTLATAVNTTETTWALSEALPAGTEYLQADDELVAVITPALYPSQRDEPTLFCEVERGVAGTLATHAQGITLTTYPAPPLGAGGPQIMSIIGPFHFAHDDAGITGTTFPDYGIELATIPPGTLVVKAWAEFTETWDNANNEIYGWVIVADSPTLGERAGIFVYDGFNVTPRTGGVRMEGDVWVDSAKSLSARAVEECVLRIQVQGSASTAGEGDVYALLATPA